MTANNVILTPAAAYLFADRALYEDDGTLAVLTSKLAVCEPAKMALTGTGRVTAARIAETLQQIGVWSQGDVLRALPELAARLRHENDVEGAPGGELQIIAALFSEATQQPEAYVVATCRFWHPPWFKPYSVYQLGSYFAPPVDHASLVGVSIEDLGKPGRSAEGDGLAIMEAQRAHVWANGARCVGGGCEVAMISGTGVVRKTLATWPDQVGQRLVAA